MGEKKSEFSSTMEHNARSSSGIAFFRKSARQKPRLAWRAVRWSFCAFARRFWSSTTEHRVLGDDWHNTT